MSETLRVTLARNATDLGVVAMERSEFAQPQYSGLSAYTIEQYLMYRGGEEQELTCYELIHLLEMSQDFQIRDLAKDVTHSLNVLQDKTAPDKRIEMFFILMYYRTRTDPAVVSDIENMVTDMVMKMTLNVPKRACGFHCTAIEKHFKRGKFAYEYGDGDEDIKRIFIRQLRRSGPTDSRTRQREVSRRSYSIRYLYP